MRVRVISNLMTRFGDAASDMRVSLDLTADHEKGRAHFQTFKNIEQRFCVFTWSIIESKCDFVRVSPPEPDRCAQPLRTHRVSRVVSR